MVEFVQAGIKVQREQEFGTLRALIERVLAPASAELFLRQVKRKGLRSREWEEILRARVFESLDRVLAASGESAERLYSGMPPSDQGQIREFYLTQVEQIVPALRAKYHRQFETF
jgi:hypothetical protein